MKLDELNLTPFTKKFLTRHKITNDMLNNLDLPAFEETYHANAKITQELLNQGFLKSKTGEKYIRELDMSTRLKNCLNTYKIYYLSQLKYLTEREIKCFRNMGQGTINELISVCDTYKMSIYKMPADVPDYWKRKRYYPELETYFAKSQIESLDIFQNITTYELFNITKQNYILTAIIYKFLLEIQTFLPWENAFIFEYLDMYYVKRFYRTYNIMYMTDLATLKDNLEPDVFNYYKYVINCGLRKWNKNQCNRS